MLSTSATANDTINAVAAEVGLTPVVDPFSSTDDNFIQLKYLLNAAIKQLCRVYDWEFLVAEHNITTVIGEEGVYTLPDDFLRMINQTGWERNNRNPMVGLSAQQWSYLKGRNLVTETIFVNFRIQQSQFNIFPSPVTSVFDINFEYVSSNSVIASSDGLPASTVVAGGDIPLFDSYLLERALKVKWYAAKGFDTTDAQDDLNEAFSLVASSDKSAPILSAGGRGYGSARLPNGFSLSDTGYGNS